MLSSPLRYPGGKAKLFEYFAAVVVANNLYDFSYCEPYAGGAGLALRLLSAGFVPSITINDIDKAIYYFWQSVTSENERFCKRIYDIPISIEEWRRQRAVLLNALSYEPFDVGFAFFYLNRTSRSGIVEGSGPIGGYAQSGQWRLDARFNRKTLLTSISQIGAMANKIKLSNLDALDFIKLSFQNAANFLYLDPPYYIKGSTLYKNFYSDSDHVSIATLLQDNLDKNWVVSYDDAPRIRNIYEKLRPISYTLGYSAGERTLGSEVIFFSDNLVAPRMRGFFPEAA